MDLINALIVYFLFNAILQREIVLNICSESAIYEQKLIDRSIRSGPSTPAQIKMMQVTLSPWCQLSRRVSCRHFLVTPMSPKMASWPWLFLVNLGTSLRQYKLRSICNPEKRGLNRKPNYRKSAKNKEYFDTKIDGKRLICDFSFVFAFTP